MSAESILKSIEDLAKKEGLGLSGYAEKIAKSKNMMFGTDTWQRCPCDSQNEER